MDYRGKRVGIIGFGVNNSELLPFLQERGAHVTILDQNPNLITPPGIEKVLGEHYLDQLTDFEIIFRTPRLPFLTPQIIAAQAAGVIVTSQTQLFLEECPCRVIAVTGTKGKGTTASLIKSMLDVAHLHGEIPGRVYLAGNIGVSPIGLLDQLVNEDWMILELSSFQTQDIHNSPYIAVILNVTQDHLDHHRSVDEYHEAKRNLVRHQDGDDYIVVNHDSDVAMSFLDITSAQPYFFSDQQPVKPGAYVKDGSVFVNFDLDYNQLLTTKDEIKLLGLHNLSNIAAAAVAAYLAGASLTSIKLGAEKFEGLPFHIENVGTKDGVTFYNDSFATNPDATIVAIKSLSQPIVLIVGGSSKGADFTEMIRAIQDSTVKTVICIGHEGRRIKTLLVSLGNSIDIIDGKTTMTEIVHQAATIARSGEVVLLSPACASQDMFKDYKDRGQQFTDAVKQL